MFGVRLRRKILDDERFSLRKCFKLQKGIKMLRAVAANAMAGDRYEIHKKIKIGTCQKLTIAGGLSEVGER
jgi:hypothetical protein